MTTSRIATVDMPWLEFRESSLGLKTKVLAELPEEGMVVRSARGTYKRTKRLGHCLSARDLHVPEDLLVSEALRQFLTPYQEMKQLTAEVPTA